MRYEDLMVSPETKGLYRKLVGRHGEERARLIISGRDKEANEDLERWNNLGRKARK